MKKSLADVSSFFLYWWIATFLLASFFLVINYGVVTIIVVSISFFYWILQPLVASDHRVNWFHNNTSLCPNNFEKVYDLLEEQKKNIILATTDLNSYEKKFKETGKGDFFTFLGNKSIHGVYVWLITKEILSAEKQPKLENFSPIHSAKLDQSFVIVDVEHLKQILDGEDFGILSETSIRLGLDEERFEGIILSSPPTEFLRKVIEPYKSTLSGLK